MNYFSEENDQSDDEWLYDSIKRYKTLQMFEVRSTPQKMSQSSSDTLCLSGVHQKTQKTELLLVRLPKKLTLPENEQNLCKDSDFLITAGCYLEKPLYSLTSNFPFIYASLYGQRAISVFQVDATDSLKYEKNIIINIESPNIFYSNHRVFAVKEAQYPLYVFDLNCCKITQFKLPEKSGTFISCLKDENISYFLNKNSGNIFRFDIRSGFEPSYTIETNLNSLNVDFSNNLIGILSNSNGVSIFDERKSNIPVLTHQVDAGNRCLKLMNKRFSISGADSNVKIYDFSKNDCELIFCHDGHTKLNGSSGSNNFVTDHLWCSNISDNFLLSCCDNGTINCWEYCTN